MRKELEVRRRALLRAYKRYLEVERIWADAVKDARSWYPAQSRPRTSFVGNPGSPIRRLHEQRQKALHQLQVSRLKLAIAKQRFSRKTAKPSVVLRLTYSELDTV